jgi:Ran-binding protein 1
LQEHAGSTKAWVYRTLDFADGELKPEMLCIRFGSEERAQDFKKAFEAGQEANKDMLGAAASGSDDEEEDKQEKDALADQLEGTKVDDVEKE